MTVTETPVDYPFPEVARDEAIERFRAIAADRPMTKVTMPVGGDAWVIHRNAAAREMLADRRFERGPFRTGERQVPYYVEFPDFLKHTLQFEDPPEHTKLRRLVQGAISPRSVAAMRESATAYAEELVDRMVAAGDSANLVSAFSTRLPIQMLCNLLGIPVEDHDKFETWAASTLSVSGMTPEEIAKNLGELHAYVAQHIAERREHPTEGLISMLANATDKDDTLTDGQILNIAMLLVVAGFDNTSNFITMGVSALLQHPEQLALLVADPEGLAPTAAEEILRTGRMFLGPEIAGRGGLVPFVAREDLVIDGQPIAAGEAVLVDPLSASNDGIALDDPHRFDVTRQGNPHLTLSFGLHHCLGAPLARMEIQVAMTVLFSKLPTLRLAGTPVVNDGHLSRTILQLPVTW